MDRLNPQQKAAIQEINRPLLVLACAGSGKTRVVTEKIAYLVTNSLVLPERIFAVTFTNKAAREMKDRVKGSLSATDSAVTICTFHSLGYRIVKQNVGALGLRSGFSIIDSQDSQQIIAELMRDELSTESRLAAAIQQRISAWKNSGFNEDEVKLQSDKEPVSVAAARVLPTYHRYLRACNSVDLDDLIWLPNQLFRNNTDALLSWQNKVRYLLVDEYQDTNEAQYQIVKKLVGQQGGLTVVGDDDQSIYAWRGAQPENLIRLNDDFPDLKVIKLEQNYRSCGRILKAANAVIANNPRAFEKTLWSELGYGDVIRVLRGKNEEHEAERVVSGIMKHQFKHRGPYSDFAILYRGNHQARIFERKLREMRIPYRLSGGLSFFDRSEIRDVMAYLRLLNNSADDNAFMRIVNTPRRGIGAGALEKLANFANSNRLSLSDACVADDMNQALSSRQANAVGAFGLWLTALRERAELDHAGELIRYLLEDIGYQGWILEQSDSPEAAERRWANVLELIEWIDRLARQSDSGPQLHEVLGQLLLSSFIDKESDQTLADEVSLSTLHAAKGLEFNHVFLAGVEENLLPHKTSTEEDNVEEERRLFYVGITRARKTLFLTFAAQRRRFGEMIDCEPSRFLQELPAEDLQWDGDVAVDPEESKATGQAHLANLRSMLMPKSA